MASYESPEDGGIFQNINPSPNVGISSHDPEGDGSFQNTNPSPKEGISSDGPEDDGTFQNINASLSSNEVDWDADECIKRFVKKLARNLNFVSTALITMYVLAIFKNVEITLSSKFPIKNFVQPLQTLALHII